MFFCFIYCDQINQIYVLGDGFPTAIQIFYILGSIMLSLQLIFYLFSLGRERVESIKVISALGFVSAGNDRPEQGSQFSSLVASTWFQIVHESNS